MGRGPDQAELRSSGLGVERESKPRIVITGMGAITNLGLDVKTFSKNIIEARSGISPIELPYTGVKVAGKIHDFNPEVALEGLFKKSVDVKRMSRSVQFATAATKEALADAGLLGLDNKITDIVDENRIGTIIGTGIGGASNIVESERILAKGGRVNFTDLFSSEPERVASAVSMTFGLKGPVLMVSAACATGNAAVIHGAQQILLGEADMMVVGGAEACLHEVTLSLFESVRLAVTRNSDPLTASKPYNKESDGFVMSEGAGIFVIESLEHARIRGARIYAEVAGYGMTADAYHDTAPSVDGQVRAINLAMRNADIPKEKLIYINTHGTSTSTGDPAELTAIKKALPEQNKVLSATKSMIGHKVGAAGAVEGIATIKALNDDIFPPNH